MRYIKYGKYRIYENGLIYSEKTRKCFLRPYDVGKGYQSVKLDGKNVYVHKLVAKCFIGERPNETTINHKDGNKQNNHYSNLEYISNEENYKHALKNGLKRNIFNVFTPEQLSDMAEFYCNTNYSMREICSWIGFEKGVLIRLLNGKYNIQNYG
jgi:hypothetical protein